MKKTTKTLSSLCLILSLGIGLTACSTNTGQQTNTSNQQTNTNSKQTNTNSKQTNTNNQQTNTNTNNDSTDNTNKWQITEEANPDIKMENQPISSFWFPEQLLEWNAEDDKDFAYNVSTVPLAKRVESEKLTPVNDNQNKDTKVVSISIMNGSTSGNPSHGTNKFDANTFTYWQYVDTLVYWGGSSGEGLIVPPSPDVTDAAHRNGVPVLGTIFFPMAEHGGKLEWLEQFLQKDEAGNFPMTDKLIEVTQLYGFDGWFINQETQGTQEQPLKPKHAKLMQQFIKQLKEKANDDITIMWYDSMTKKGKMDWQNALTDKNSYFLLDNKGNPVADSMFLNFWWTNDSLADKQLIKSSKEKANSIGINPYDLYAGVDVQSNGILTPIRWDLFEDGKGKTNTSLGLYCPSWTYFSTSMMDEFERNENALWVNPKGNPSISSSATGTEWRGISNYAIEKTPISQLPFVTNFSTGNGYNFFIDGEKVSEMDWNNRSVTDILPTYRYIIENSDGNSLNANLNFADAYYGGNSIKFRGNMLKDASSTIKLYSCDLTIDEDIIFTTAVKSTVSTSINAVLTLDDNSIQKIEGDKKVDKDWTIVSFSLKDLVGKNIRDISYEITPSEDANGYEFCLGNMTLTKEEFNKDVAISEVKVDETMFDDDNIYAGVRLSYLVSSEEIPEHYEIYRINDDNSRSLLGTTTNNCFFVNGLMRNENSLKTTFEVIPVNKNQVRGTGSTASIDWPDNSLPKSDFTASHTIIAPNESITFESLCSLNTTGFKWTFEGADQTESTDETPTVTYSQEGTYSVTLTATNEKGEDTKEVTGLITVTNDASEGLENLALNKPTQATAYVNENEAPQFAVDGTPDKKWCATGTPPHEITIDLEEEKLISEVKILHAEAGGESPDMNTQKYTISVSTDGNAFTEVLTIKKNSKGETLDTFPAVKAKYVKLSVEKPTQGSDSAARIYEIEVYGIK